MTTRCWMLAVTGGTVLAGVGVARGNDLMTAGRFLVLGGALAMAVAYDIRERRIPNAIVGPATVLCLLFDAVARIDWRGSVPALAIIAILLSLALAQPHALGMGDVKLGTLIVVGVPSGATVAFIAALFIGASFGLALTTARRRSLSQTALPLAPFLALGVLVTFV